MKKNTKGRRTANTAWELAILNRDCFHFRKRLTDPLTHTHIQRERERRGRRRDQGNRRLCTFTCSLSH